jgi:uncharacterized protein
MSAVVPTADRVLGLFAKEPVPGRVKTRLTSDPARAARVAEAFLLDLLDRFRAVEARLILAYSPPTALPYFRQIIDGRIALLPQVDGDLGRRMAAFFTTQLAAGASRVVLLGTDSPTVPLDHIEQAFAALAEADLVLGPATDGGYYLVGCARRVPPVFDGVAWGTADVLRQTVDRLADPGYRLALLPPWYDVDTPDDYRFLRAHLAALVRSGVDPGLPRTLALGDTP